MSLTLSTTQAERLLGLSERTIRRMIAAGEIKAVKTEAEGRWIIPIIEICRLTGLGVAEIQGFLPTRDQVVNNTSPLPSAFFGPTSGQLGATESRPAASDSKPPHGGRETASQASRPRPAPSTTNPSSDDPGETSPAVEAAIQTYLKLAHANDPPERQAKEPKTKPPFLIAAKSSRGPSITQISASRP